MRIAFVTLGFDPFRTSGFDVSGERLVQLLLDNGHSVTVVAAKKNTFTETVAHPNVTIHRLPLGRSDWIRYSLRAANFVDQSGPYDVVHFYDVYFSYAYHGSYVASLQHSFRQRLVGLGPFRWRNGLNWLVYFTYYHLALNLAEKRGLRRAGLLLASSTSAAMEYTKNYDISLDKIALVKHCIDTNYFVRVQPTELKIIRDKNQISAQDLLILFVGFITPRKGLEYLAQAMPKLDPMPKLIIVGKWRNQAYRNYITKLFEPFRSQIIETGFVEDDQMPLYYSLADIYVSPSQMEGFGLPLGEALACETPVVAFDVGATAEVVGPGGILVPPRDVDGLANAINYLLQNPDVRQAMGKEGRQHILNEFSVEAMLNSTLAAYRRFLNTPE